MAWGTTVQRMVSTHKIAIFVLDTVKAEIHTIQVRKLPLEELLACQGPIGVLCRLKVFLDSVWALS